MHGSHFHRLRLRVRAAGFTLVELLAVLAIIGVLVALLLPAVQAARESARRAHCQNNLHQLGVAFNLHVEQRGEFPVGCIGCKLNLSAPGEPLVPQRFISWNTHLLPFLEQEQLWRELDFSEPSFAAVNKPAGSTVVRSFLCPSVDEDVLHNRTGLWKGFAFTDYGGIYGVEGEGRTELDTAALHWLRPDSLGMMLYEVSVAPRQVTDGLSYTAIVAEMVRRRTSETEWVNGHNVFAQEASTPINVASNLGNEIGSPHPGGAQLVFCDGHVEFVSDGIAQPRLIGMLTKSDEAVH
jgi:prepilin-type N-terminal cleavage/methylation domain-containing protein/prepilin-type processing-associated H-X9-DG protein